MNTSRSPEQIWADERAALTDRIDAALEALAGVLPYAETRAEDLSELSDVSPEMWAKDFESSHAEAVADTAKAWSAIEVAELVLALGKVGR